MALSGLSTPITAIRHRCSSFCTWPTYLPPSPESFSRCRLRWTTPPSPHLYFYIYSIVLLVLCLFVCMHVCLFFFLHSLHLSWHSLWTANNEFNGTGKHVFLTVHMTITALNPWIHWQCQSRVTLFTHVHFLNLAWQYDSNKHLVLSYTDKNKGFETWKGVLNNLFSSTSFIWKIKDEWFLISRLHYITYSFFSSDAAT